MAEEKVAYTEDNIRSLDWKEHIRMRPGMYIGKLGDGSAPDDRIYVLVKEVMDNSIDESLAGYCSEIKVHLHADGSCSIQDNGRGIPVDVHPKHNMPALELVLTNLHAGGKFGKVRIRYPEDCTELVLSVSMQFPNGSWQKLDEMKKSIKWNFPGGKPPKK